MSESMQSALRQNLVWIIGLVVCVVVAIGAALTSGDGDDGNQGASKAQEEFVKSTGIEPKYLRKIIDPPPPPKTPEEKVQEIIQDYDVIIADPETSEEDKARHLYAKANLMMRDLKDVRGAIKIYEDIIINYPNDVKADPTHFRLYDAYASIGDNEGMRWVSQSILNKYPEGPRHKWAARNLGIELIGAENPTQN